MKIKLQFLKILAFLGLDGGFLLLRKQLTKQRPNIRKLLQDADFREERAVTFRKGNHPCEIQLCREWIRESVDCHKEIAQQFL